MRIDFDAVLRSSILATLLFSAKIVKFDPESDSKYFFISSDHKFNTNRVSADGIMLIHR